MRKFRAYRARDRPRPVSSCKTEYSPISTMRRSYCEENDDDGTGGCAGSVPGCSCVCSGTPWQAARVNGWSPRWTARRSGNCSRIMTSWTLSASMKHIIAIQKHILIRMTTKLTGAKDFRIWENQSIIPMVLQHLRIYMEVI